ncbi:MAG: RagB/SusD family nutrient uptake outer membrane protein [Bacteroidota bacterium]
MKIYLKFFLFALLAVSFVACDDDLGIEPEQDLSIDGAFLDANTARASLVGVYSRAQDLEVFGGMPLAIAEFQADNVNFIGSFPTLQDINNYVTQPDNGSIRGIWRDHYRVILAANAVIANIPNVDDPGFVQADRDQFVAEAKFLRALTYLNLVKLFAQPFTLDNGASPGVPLVLEPFILQGQIDVLPARNSVSEVYDQIERDLSESLTALPESYSSVSETRGRATIGAANALLSRVALYKADWTTAESFADAVLASSLYELAPDYSFYDANTSETIFALQMTAIDNSRTGSGGLAGYFAPATLGGRGDAPYSQDLLDSYEDGDLRFENLSLTVPVDGIETTFTTKYSDAINNTDDAPILRVTEMLLNKAEAQLQQGSDVDEEAVEIINRLRERAGLEAVEPASAEEALEILYDERRKELAFEGFRRYDLLRIGEPLREDLPAESAPGADRVVLPIPQTEIDLGSSLPQNKGY